jgi:transcriptional regulator with XRE-family HTH domain
VSESSDQTRGPTVDPIELAKRVRAKREAEKLSLREAGEELGMSAATLSRVESGNHLPERDHLLQLADWAGMSLDAPARRVRNQLVHGEDASTVEAVELHLRADKNLNPDDAEFLVQLVKTAYDRMSQRK